MSIREWLKGPLLYFKTICPTYCSEKQRFIEISWILVCMFVCSFSCFNLNNTFYVPQLTSAKTLGGKLSILLDSLCVNYHGFTLLWFQLNSLCSYFLFLSSVSMEGSTSLHATNNWTLVQRTALLLQSQTFWPFTRKHSLLPSSQVICSPWMKIRITTPSPPPSLPPTAIPIE